MKKLLILFGLVLLLSCCGLNKSKITGTWNVSNFTINGESFEKGRYYYRNVYKVKSIQFLENDFFILNIEQTIFYSGDRFFEASKSIENISYKGKWKAKGFSGIEYEFFDEPFDIGLQKGSCLFNNNFLLINGKGDSNFSSLYLYK